MMESTWGNFITLQHLCVSILWEKLTEQRKKNLQENLSLSTLAVNIILNPLKVKSLNPEIAQLQKCVTVFLFFLSESFVMKSLSGFKVGDKVLSLMHRLAA